MIEAHGCAALAQQLHRGFDQHVAQALARDQRPAGAPAREQRLADDRAGKAGGAERRIDVQRREQQRLHQALIERAIAFDLVADELVVAGPEQRHHRGVVGRLRVRHALAVLEDPERNAAVVHLQQPALVGLEIDERELGMLRSLEAGLGADRACIVEHARVARQHEVIAVVDDEVGRSIVERAAAPAGLRRRLVQVDAEAGIRQPDRRGKAGHAGADDMDVGFHQMNAYRRRMDSLASLPRRTGARGDGEAAGDQQIEDAAVVLAHDARRAHELAGIAIHDLVRLLVVLSGAGDHRFTGPGQVRVSCDGGGIVGGNSGRGQRFARQIEPADRGVLVDVAQDVGELQRAAEVMREGDAVVALQAEHVDRQAADGAGDAVAVEIERRPVRRADVLARVHLHAVDDRQEILALQVEALDGGGIVGKARRRLAGIDRVDVLAPLLQVGALALGRQTGVGDVVDLAAEVVDQEHRVALLGGQDAHRRVERGGRCRSLLDWA